MTAVNETTESFSNMRTWRSRRNGRRIFVQPNGRVWVEQLATEQRQNIYTEVVRRGHLLAWEHQVMPDFSRQNKIREHSSRALLNGVVYPNITRLKLAVQDLLK